jgi:hypothetical protein
MLNLPTESAYSGKILGRKKEIKKVHSSDEK